MIPIKIHSTTLALMVLLAAAAAPLPVHADELTGKGRAIFSKYRQAVVTVQLVIKDTFPPSPGAPKGATRTNESKRDATGTVISPAGLIVLSLSAVNPGQFIQNMVPAGNPRFKMESELLDLKILLEDGTEMPAEVVLREKDLDLAFIRPTAKPVTPMATLDLTSAGTADVLDQLVTLNRLGRAANRAYSASAERIGAVVRTPRLFYVPETSATLTSLGCPAFTLEGKPLGIFVMSSAKSKASTKIVELQPENMVGIIRPAGPISWKPPSRSRRRGK